MSQHESSLLFELTVSGEIILPLIVPMISFQPLANPQNHVAVFFLVEVA